MNYYCAYGLTIESEFELPELPRVESSTPAPDVTFVTGEVAPLPPSAEAGGLRIVATPDRCRLGYDGIGRFLVEAGQRVTFDPASPAVAGRMVVRRLFENEMSALLLHQRGHLVLHASAVAVDGHGAIFLGPQGAGKSTTAVAFHEYGHAVLEDDLVAISLDGEPTVRPGVPQLRLTPDAVDALDVAETTSYDHDGGSGKRYLDLDGLPDSVPLSRCYLLQDGPSIRFDEVSAREQLVSLIAQTYVQGLLSDTDATTDHFRQCSSIVESIPFRTLARPLDHDTLPALVDAVASDLIEHDGPSEDIDR